MKRSFYEMLEVSRKATQNQIDNAYEKLTGQLVATTSVRGTAESLTQMNMLREGYKILSDPEKRALYDAKLCASDAGIKLMFFPKDTRAVKKLGVETIIFAALACVFTYVVYQKLVRETDAGRFDQPRMDGKIPNAPGKTPSLIESPSSAPDATAVGKAGEK